MPPSNDSFVQTLLNAYVRAESLHHHKQTVPVHMNDVSFRQMSPKTKITENTEPRQSFTFGEQFTSTPKSEINTIYTDITNLHSYRPSSKRVMKLLCCKENWHFCIVEPGANFCLQL